MLRAFITLHQIAWLKFKQKLVTIEEKIVNANCFAFIYYLPNFDQSQLLFGFAFCCHLTIIIPNSLRPSTSPFFYCKNPFTWYTFVQTIDDQSLIAI